MRRLSGGLVLVAIVGLWLGPAEAAPTICPPDSVAVGPACVDKYEATVWFVPASQNGLIYKIRNGTVKLSDLTSVPAVAAGVVQLGLAVGDLAANGCPDTGNGCKDFYAVSIIRCGAPRNW